MNESTKTEILRGYSRYVHRLDRDFEWGFENPAALLEIDDPRMSEVGGPEKMKVLNSAGPWRDPSGYQEAAEQNICQSPLTAYGSSAKRILFSKPEKYSGHAPRLLITESWKL